MEEARHGSRAVTRRFGLINTKSNIKVIRREMEILRVTMGFNLLVEIGCAYITRVVGLIPHIPLSSMIHGPPV